MIKKISIIGSGSWATALVKVFSDSGVHVSWLVRTQKQADYIAENRRNPRYLSYASLNLDFITPGIDIEAALQDTTLVVFALPSAYLGEIVSAIAPEWISGKQMAVSIKSFVPGTNYIPGIFLEKHFEPDKPVLVLSGPCHAEEIAMERNTYLTVAGSDMSATHALGASITASYIQVVYNTDPMGIQYSSILKNIIGIATGIACGLHYGVNFQAVLVSNALREIKVFLDSICPAKRDLYDSAYFGDVLVTAYSDYSRNRTLGKLIGRGLHVSKALQSMEMIAEGYCASTELSSITRKMNIPLPVMNSIYRILHEHANPFHEFRLIENQLR